MRSLLLVAGLLLPACAVPEAPPASSPPASAGLAASTAAPPASAELAPSAAAPPPSDAPAPDRCGATAAGAFTNEPITIDGRTLTPAQIKATLLSELQPSTSHGGVAVCSYLVYAQDPGKLYLEALCAEVIIKDGRVVTASGRRTPAVIDLDATGAPSGVRTPGDGSQYGKDMDVLFPPHARQAMKTRVSLPKLEQALNAEAACRLGVSSP